jgi:hypothetical protein
MLRRITAISILLSCVTAAAWAESPSTAPSVTAPPAPTKPVAKKPATKAKTAVKPPIAAEGGPCTLGVISAIGDQFSVQKFGVTVFEEEANEIPINDWGLDDLVLARVRASAGADPTIRKIAYPKGAFEPFYNPKSRFLPDPNEGLPAIVRNVTANANCERYLVVTTFKGKVPGTNLMVNGIGTYNQGLGNLIRHSHLFANIDVSVIDGRSYERINRPFANFGTRLAEGLRITEDPLTKLDNSFFPDPASAAASSATLRERTRALVAARLDQALPTYLKEQ